MNNRILITVLVFLMLPTALLSLLAGLSVRSRELVLMEQTKTGAESMVRLCSEEVDSRLKNDLVRVREGVGSVLMRTASLAELARVGGEIEDARALVERVVVYHDPWDVVYPSELKAAEGGRSGQDLVELLRSAAAARKPSDDRIGGRTADGSLFCLTLIPGRNDLYAGFVIKRNGLRAMLDEILVNLSNEDVLLKAGGLYNRDEVIVEDPLFSPATGSGIDSFADSQALLAEERLWPPLDDIEVCAYARNPVRLHKASRDQGRLLGWGIALLAGGIVCGVVILVGQINREVRRANARANYIIGISHDLRTPIASLKMMTDSLYEKTVKDPEKQHQFLGAMAGECERLNRLIERVLYFVRFGEDALVFFKKPLESGRLIRTTVDSFFETAAGLQESIKYELRLGSDLPEVCADEGAVSQVILNLLDNAVKYGGAGRPEGDVRVLVEAGRVMARRGVYGKNRSWLRVKVSDNGPGIQSADARRLFRPYFRAKTAANANISGVGLGLALCRHIVNAHKGWIEAGSGEGGGAAFTFYLPAEIN